MSGEISGQTVFNASRYQRDHRIGRFASVFVFEESAVSDRKDRREDRRICQLLLGLVQRHVILKMKISRHEDVRQNSLTGTPCIDRVIHKKAEISSRNAQNDTYKCDI